MPSEDVLAAIAHDRDLRLTPEMLRAASEFLARYRHELEQLRAVDLSFLPPYIQPATALTWIENGGRSPSRS
jgi:hypothetical protein